MTRFATAADFAVLAAPHYEIHGRLLIENTVIDSVLGFNPFLSGTISADLDSPVIQAQFRCHLGSGVTNLSPLMSTGAQLSGSPMFNVGRSVAFETSCDLPGTGPSNWRRVFQGAIDAVDPAAGGEDVILLECRDIVSLRLQKWIDIISVTDQGPQFGFPITGARVDLAMQSILDQSYGGLFPEPFRVLGIPDLAITDYWQDSMSMLDALRRIGLENGWDLRGKWDGEGGIDTFALTYYDPDRAMDSSTIVYIRPTGDGPKYMAINSCRVDLSGVRNRIFVTPADITRVPQMAEDTASQLLYGLQSSQISEDRASHIDTEAEASVLAQLILADSKDPKIAIEIAMRYYWIPEVNDVFGVVGNGVHFDADPLVVGIQGYTHTFTEDGDATTVLRTRTSPAAAGKEWRRGVPRMQYSSLNEPAGPGIEGATWLQILDDALPTVL